MMPNAQNDTTVTPMVLGSLVYGALGLGCLLLALRPWERRSMPSGSCDSSSPSRTRKCVRAWAATAWGVGR